MRYIPTNKKNFVIGQRDYHPSYDPNNPIFNPQTMGIDTADWWIKRCAVCKMVCTARQMIGFVCKRCLARKDHQRYNWEDHMKDAVRRLERLERQRKRLRHRE